MTYSLPKGPTYWHLPLGVRISIWFCGGRGERHWHWEYSMSRDAKSTGTEDWVALWVETSGCPGRVWGCALHTAEAIALCTIAVAWILALLLVSTVSLLKLSCSSLLAFTFQLWRMGEVIVPISLCCDEVLKKNPLVQLSQCLAHTEHSVDTVIIHKMWLGSIGSTHSEPWKHKEC